MIVTPHGFGALLHTEGVPVWIWSTVPLEPGESLAVTGRLRTPRGFLDPGSAGPRDA